MPYIKQEDRNKWIINDADEIDQVAGKICTVGELNYCFTKLIIGYLKNVGLNYTNLNGAIGALSCCASEVKRRLMSKYETKKIAENGDVFPEEML